MNPMVRTLVRKEFTEAFRDRKVIFMAVVLPVVIYPIMMGGSSYLERRQESETRSKTLRVAVTSPLTQLERAVAADTTLSLSSSDLPPDSLQALVARGSVNLWVDAPQGFAAVGDTTVPVIRLVHDRSESDSREAVRRVQTILQDLRGTERQSRFENLRGEGVLVDVLASESVDVATESEAAGASGGRMLVYVLLMMLFMGGGAFATDIVAGEKERGTLETLFLIPSKRHVIAHAKLVFVGAGTALTGSLTVLGLWWSLRMGWFNDDGMSDSFGLDATSLVLLVLLVVPLAVLVGTVLLAISAYSRSLKEAQTFQMPMMFVIFIPALLATSQAVELNPLLALVPVANVAFAMRDVVLGRIDWVVHGMAVLATFAWSAVALRWVGSVMSREEMVLGFDPEPFLARTQGGRTRALHVGLALTVLVYFYLGQTLQTKYLIKGLYLSLWVLLPLCGFAVMRFAWSGGQVSRILSLRAPSASGLLAGLLLGVGSMLPIAGGLAELQGRFLPAPEMQMAEAIKMFADRSYLELVFLLALSPAICEEVVFRGIGLGMLRRVTNDRAAILLSSMYFAVIHLSLYRLAPTFALGVVMAVLTVRTRSLFPAVLFHFVYNGGLVAGGRYAESHELPLDPNGVLAWILSLAALGLGAFLLVQSSRREPNESTPRI